MINYLDKISLDFFNTSNPDLDFLRWIIAKKYEKDSTFLESLIKNNYKKLYPEPANISSKDYEKRIYQYALEEIPNSIHSQQTEYAFLLYFYAKLSYASYKGSLKNNILDYIIPYVRNVNVTPVAGKPIPDSELESYLKEATSTKYYLNALSLTDRIIFILYLWITDMCFSAQYLTEKKNMLLPSCNTYIDIPHSYEDNIWEKRASSASLYNYFFYKPHTQTYDCLYADFIDYMKIIPSAAFTFMPAITTFIINTMNPNGKKEKDLSLKKLREKNNAPKKIIRKMQNINETSSTLFLKFILLEKVDFYDKRSIYSMPTRFSKRENEILNRYNYSEELNSYLDSINNTDVKELAKYLFAMKDNGFTFTYSCFDYFNETYKMRNEFCIYNAKMDIILSSFMLNEYTKWFDALMLMNRMPLEFCRQKHFLFLKILSTQQHFQRVVAELAKVDISTADDKVILNYKGKVYSFGNFFNQFYKLAEKRLNCDDFAEIFLKRKSTDAFLSKKTDTGKRQIRPEMRGIFSIIKWIYLLEHSCVYRKNIDIDRLITTKFQIYKQKLEQQKIAANHGWLEAIILDEIY